SKACLMPGKLTWGRCKIEMWLAPRASRGAMANTAVGHATPILSPTILGASRLLSSLFGGSFLRSGLLGGFFLGRCLFLGSCLSCSPFLGGLLSFLLLATTGGSTHGQQVERGFKGQFFDLGISRKTSVGLAIGD